MDPYIHRMIRFIILVVFSVPSFICYLLIFYFTFKTRQITSKYLQHHFVFALLFCNLIFITTDLPITLIFSYQDYVPFQSDQFCSFLIAYNYALDVTGLLLTAFGSIERYFLIFHKRMVRRWRRVIHYPCILICFIYPTMFYSVMVNMYPCQHDYHYDLFVCGGACYEYLIIPGTADYIINIFLLVVVIVVANMILLFRVIKHRQTMRIANTWRKNRLMCIQLVSISILYFLSWIPLVIALLIRLFYNPLLLRDAVSALLYYCIYIAPLASPFVSLIGLPAVRRRLTRSVSRIVHIDQATRNRIMPIVSCASWKRVHYRTTRV